MHLTLASFLEGSRFASGGGVLELVDSVSPSSGDPIQRQGDCERHKCHSRKAIDSGFSPAREAPTSRTSLSAAQLPGSMSVSPTSTRPCHGLRQIKSGSEQASGVPGALCPPIDLSTWTLISRGLRVGYEEVEGEG